ncbi:acyl-CoA thioesterase [Alteraurantiacibacter buctensis]|uniref:Acyl-CoA thioesterase n=1 Tax=Alteraurantiacibacter buctensis TaxID=1503981 RepID=A0A844Z2U9_9SPHN|nr:acyl-CoA thioesterase [Alteraurantiacibacter buctensis]MXO73014.1 acyl-CoA thioesterase [Alteraurantiacibacter buctensis]
MFSNTRTWTIEWGDCDPAGIVFYPRFFAAFDTSTARLIEAATSRTSADLMREHGIIGWPMVETGARFIEPASFGEQVHIETQVTRVGRSSFGIAHRLLKDGRLCLEATEVRVWAAHSPVGLGIMGVPIPEQIAQQLRGG